MHIIHVTPHLPPDQAANALLPWQLGLWAAEDGDTVEYVAHPPRAGQPAKLPGPATWIPRRKDGLVSRMLRLGAIGRGAADSSGARACDRTRGCGARAQQRPARRARRSPVAAARKAGRSDALRHRDLALCAEAVRAGSLHARVSRGLGGDLLQRAPARTCARARPDAAAHADRVSPGRSAVRLARRGGSGRRPASRWGSRTATCW